MPRDLPGGGQAFAHALLSGFRQRGAGLRAGSGTGPRPFGNQNGLLRIPLAVTAEVQVQPQAGACAARQGGILALLDKQGGLPAVDKKGHSRWLVLAEAVFFEAAAQLQLGPVHNHPVVGRGEAQLLTNFFGR